MYTYKYRDHPGCFLIKENNGKKEEETSKKMRE